MVNYFEFEPTEFPKWREKNEKFKKLPSVSQMIKDITGYSEQWAQLSKKFTNMVPAIRRRMVIEFLHKLQQEEDIGVQDKGTIEKMFDQENSDRDNEPPLKRKRMESKKDEEDTSLAKEEDCSDEQNNISSLPDIDDIFPEEPDQDQNLKKLKETKNLLKGYWHLKEELEKLSEKERSEYAGEIEVPVCIKNLHKILMEDLIPPDRTQPGEFSTLPRSTTFNGKEHLYPSFATKAIAYDAVDQLTLEYNTLVRKIPSKISHEKVEMALKSATLLLFGFLTLHPFSDGNGRLARLLCNHCLRMTFCPFPTAIYNMFSPSTRDDYLDAIVNGRTCLKLNEDQIKDECVARKEVLEILAQGPSDLCSLVIESNWFTWRKFLYELGINIELLDFEKRNLAVKEVFST